MNGGLLGFPGINRLFGRKFKTLADQRAAQIYLGLREVLTEARTYYVRTDGKDTNDGLLNNPGNAFLTIQAAVDLVCGTLDFGNHNVTIQVGNGTYAAGVNLKKYFAGAGTPTLLGDATTPGNVIISVTAAGATSGRCIASQSGGGVWTVNGFRLQTSSSGTDCVRTDGLATTFLSNMEFGACVGSHLIATQVGGRTQMNTDYSILGGATNHILTSFLSQVAFVSGITVTLTGTPAFSGRYATATDMGSIASAGVTFSGAATGTRYLSTRNSSIFTNGGGANFFPGNVAGTASLGGQYN